MNGLFTPKTLQVGPFCKNHRSYYRKTPSTYSKCTSIHVQPQSKKKSEKELEEQERKRREEEEQRKKKDGGLDRLLHSLSLANKRHAVCDSERSCLCIFPGIYQKFDIS